MIMDIIEPETKWDETYYSTDNGNENLRKGYEKL
jgi:hypothetical protein